MKERILLIIPIAALFAIAFHAIRPELGSQLLLSSQSFWLKKTFNTKKYDAIICGDSRVYRGVSPQAIQQEFKDIKILNFGFSSGGYSDLMYREINKHLADDSDNKMLILGITPYSITPRAAKNKSLTNYKNIKREERIEKQYFSSLLSYFIPFTFSDLEKSRNGAGFFNPKIETYFDNGWVASDFVYPNPDYALKSYSTTFNNNQVSDHLINKLCSQIIAWQSKDISVYAYRPPTTDKMVALEDSLSGFKETQIIQQLEKSGAVWLSFNDSNYYSYDGSHLQDKSAFKFSQDLAKKIKDQ